VGTNPSRDRSGRSPVSNAPAVGCGPLELGPEIARALHDGIAQDLFLARMTLAELAGRLMAGSMERTMADGALERITDAICGTRGLIDGLRSTDGSMERDLACALRREMIDFAARTGISVSHSESGPPPALPPQVVTHILAIVREALANVHKHAGASEVRLRARHRQGWTRLTVTDDGLGFRTMPLGGVEGGMGMGTMHERARAIGGRIALRSAAGDGTTVTIDVPPQGASIDAW